MKKAILNILLFLLCSCSSVSFIHQADVAEEDHDNHIELSTEIAKEFTLLEPEIEVKKQTIKPKFTLLGDEVDYTRGLASLEISGFAEEGMMKVMPVVEEKQIPLSKKELDVVDSSKRYQDMKLDPDRVLKFLWPLQDSYRVTSKYGKRKLRRKKSMHKGIDIGAPKGSPIVAAEAGKVIYSGRMGSYGNVTIVAHNDDYHTVYAHAIKNLTKKGDFVERGQVIAKVGSTGRSTGNHLHFEIRFDNTALNPMDFYQGLGLASNP